MKMRHLVVALLVLGLAASMPAPAFSQAKSDTIKIGAFLPMTSGVAGSARLRPSGKVRVGGMLFRE